MGILTKSLDHAQNNRQTVDSIRGEQEPTEQPSHEHFTRRPAQTTSTALI